MCMKVSEKESRSAESSDMPMPIEVMYGRASLPALAQYAAARLAASGLYLCERRPPS